jgi:hypothetical protein
MLAFTEGVPLKAQSKVILRRFGREEIIQFFIESECGALLAAI